MHLDFQNISLELIQLAQFRTNVFHANSLILQINLSHSVLIPGLFRHTFCHERIIYLTLERPPFRQFLKSLHLKTIMFVTLWQTRHQMTGAYIRFGFLKRCILIDFRAIKDISEFSRGNNLIQSDFNIHTRLMLCNSIVQYLQNSQLHWSLCLFPTLLHCLMGPYSEKAISLNISHRFIWLCMIDVGKYLVMVLTWLF